MAELILNESKNNHLPEGLPESAKIKLESLEAIRNWLSTSLELHPDLADEIEQTIENIESETEFDYIVLQESDEAEPLGLMLDCYKGEQTVAVAHWLYDDWGNDDDDDDDDD